MRPHSIIKVLAAAALIAVPSLATAAPDQNTHPGQYNNGCNGQWVNGQCVNNGQWNNGQWNNGRHRHHDRDNDNDRDDRGDRHDNGRHNGWNNPHNPHSNGNWNNGRYGNNGYGNNGYGGYGQNGNLTGVVSSFSPYNLYLNNGLHVVLHDGTVINPRGTNLTAGQRVRIIGYRNQDGTFAANEIDVVGSGNGYYRY